MKKTCFRTLLMLSIIVVTVSCAVSGLGKPDAEKNPDESHPDRSSTSFERPFTRTLRLSSPAMTGSDVRLLQTLLNDWARATGHTPLVVDGSFGSVTNSMVRSFQSANGLYVDGIAGPVTLNKLISVFTLGSTWISPYYRSLALSSPTLSGGDVRALQQAYNGWARATGRSTLLEDGVFGSVTRTAIITFQNAESRLLADGVAGRQTQRLLFIRSWNAPAAVSPIPDSSWTRPLAGYVVTQEFKGASVHNGIDLAKPSEVLFTRHVPAGSKQFCVVIC